MTTMIIGVDLADASFELAIANVQFEIQQRKRLSRLRFTLFRQELPPSLFLMEACSAAHHWGRILARWGHEVRLLPVQYVRPYVHRSKTDGADAAALLEASRCQTVRPVPIKTVEQQHLRQLHRLREQYKSTGNARLNLLRGALMELGVLVPKGLRDSLPGFQRALRAHSTPLPAQMRRICTQLLDEIQQLQVAMDSIETQLAESTREDPIVQRLLTICGVGPLIATAIRASVGHVERFPSGRHLACWLGLTAREYSLGERHRLGRISRQGDRYIRTLLVNGARSALMAANRFYPPGGPPLDRVRLWALGIQQRRGLNKATVALASKLARIIWAAWRHERAFDGNWTHAVAGSGLPAPPSQTPGGPS
jgi:transposase